MNFYETLGVEPTASAGELRRAYHLRLQLFHPDHHAGAAPEVVAAAERATSQLNAAWAVLRDPHSRALYDHSLTTPHKTISHPRSDSPWAVVNLADPAPSHFVARV